MKHRTTETDMSEYSFVIFGNSRFGGYNHRGQAIARELAKRGYQVVFIEEMPSLAAELRRKLRWIFSRQAIDEQSDNREQFDTLRVLRPPLIPTLFRSSYTPIIDKWIFRAWFDKKLSLCDWNNTIAIVMLPYWWCGFICTKKYSLKLIHYDVYDLLDVSSRNEKALHRMKEGERRLRNEIGLVTFSAQSMKASISQSFPNATQVCIPNATSKEFISYTICEKPHKEMKKNVGFIGSLDPRWLDTELLLHTIESFPLYDFSICGSVDHTYACKLIKYPNVKMIGFKNHIQLATLAATFDVGLIPFKHNVITRVVNPLKLYEYFAAGIPVVAMRTDELEYYRDMIYLSDTREEFIRNVTRSLADDNNQKRLERREWAKMNTWKQRIDVYISILEKILKTK
jgi:glycosyltransferase involved in cell wall biosynthesis